MTVTLAIDTAAPRLQLGLLLADGRFDSSVDAIATGHAEIIFARIGALLARHGLDYPDLARVVTTTGPGSFTGLRIGLSAARGIGLARHIPVIGVSNLIALSLAAAGPSRVVLDARRAEAYRQDFSAPGVPAGPAALLPMEAARAGLPAGTSLLETPFVDMEALTRHGAGLDPALYPPEPDYIRDADAKPQTAARIARLGR